MRASKEQSKQNGIQSKEKAMTTDNKLNIKKSKK